VPAILMARFAVTREEQGHGIGTSLFKDALLRALHASEAIGGRIFLVHAKDEAVATRYERWGMERFPLHPLHLCFLFKDVRKTLGL
jgi:GNAT superfamily N-acetyltransferase